MITKFHIENFKSLWKFDLPAGNRELGQFNCLIGLNGSGKTTVLQAFDFLAQLAVGNVSAWLDQRGWKSIEITSSPRRTKVVTFHVSIADPGGQNLSWQGWFNTTELRCTKEVIESNGTKLLEVVDGKYFAAGLSDYPEAVKFVYQGSILSILNLQNADPGIGFVRETLAGLKSLELLSPNLIRHRSRKTEDLGTGGDQLAGFLANLKLDQLDRLNKALREFYPHFVELDISKRRGGWVDLKALEIEPGLVEVNLGHINDGFLRMLAILAQAEGRHQILLFDEIENGINPELINKLISFLVGLKKQVFVTTHSPLILNYLPDEIAKKAVVFLYRDKLGRTRSTPFFEISEPARKLASLGPGEVFADTNLTNLAAQLAESP